MTAPASCVSRWLRRASSITNRADNARNAAKEPDGFTIHSSGSSAVRELHAIWKCWPTAAISWMANVFAPWPTAPRGQRARSSLNSAAISKLILLPVNVHSRRASKYDTRRSVAELVRYNGRFVSSHELGVAASVQLACRLRRAPARCRVFGIEIATAPYPSPGPDAQRGSPPGADAGRLRQKRSKRFVWIVA